MSSNLSCSGSGTGGQYECRSRDQLCPDLNFMIRMQVQDSSKNNYTILVKRLLGYFNNENTFAYFFFLFHESLYQC